MNHSKKEQELLDKFAMAAIPALMQIDARKAEAELRNDEQPIPEDVSAGYCEPEHFEEIAEQAYTIAQAMLSRRKIVLNGKNR